MLVLYNLQFVGLRKLCYNHRAFSFYTATLSCITVTNIIPTISPLDKMEIRYLNSLHPLMTQYPTTLIICTNNQVSYGFSSLLFLSFSLLPLEISESLFPFRIWNLITIKSKIIKPILTLNHPSIEYKKLLV